MVVVDDSVFWLGPLGALRALPSPSLGGAPEMVPVRTGGLHRSITGRPTLDRLGIRRTWVLTWPYLDEDTHRWLSLLYAGLLGGPVWLLDPTAGNRLPVQVATAGSVEHGPEGFATAGTLTWQATPVTPPDHPAPAGSGALTWTTADTGGGLLLTRSAVPVLPGEPVTFAASAASTVPVTLTAFVLNAADVVITTVSTAPATPSSGGARMRLTVPATDGAASVRPGLVLGQAGTVTTSAWSLTSGPEPVEWSAGGGAAMVLIESLPWKYPVPGSFATTLTLLEV